MQYELWLKTGETNELLVGSVVVSVTNATSVTTTGAGEGRYKVELIGFVLQDSYSSFDLVDENGEVFYTGSFTTFEFEFNAALPLAQVYLYFTAGSMPVGSEFKLYKLDSEEAWTLLDLGDDSPAMNFQVNDLANIQDKKASYSQQLTLPITDRNSAAFGFPDQMDAVNRIPYEAKPCALYCDGVEIVSDEFRLELRQVNHRAKTLSCQIVSNTLDFAQRLTNTLFSATPLDPIDWTREDMERVRNSGDWYTYMVAASVKGSILPLGQTNNRVYYSSVKPFYVSNGYEHLLLNNVRPWINLKAVFDKILEQHGYLFETNIEEFPEYMSLTDLVSQSDSFNRYNKTLTSGPFTASSVPAYPFQLFPTSNPFELGEVAPGSYLDPNIPADEDPERTYGVIYASPGFINVRFVMNSSVSGGTFRCRISRLDGTVIQDAPNTPYEVQWASFEKSGSVIVQEDVTGGTAMFTSDLITLVPGERLYLEIIATTAMTTRTVSIDVKVDPADNLVCSAGCKIYPAMSTNFNTQADFVKAFLQVYGLTLSVVGNTVKMYTMQEVIDRRDMYIDWSDKMDKGSEVETSFRLSGYAQRNRIKFQQNDDSLDGGTEDYADIIIDDATLSDVKELMTLPFASSKDVLVSGGIRVGGSAPMAMEAFIYENDDTLEYWAYTYSGTPTNGSFERIRIPVVRYSTPKHYLAIPGNYSGVIHIASYSGLVSKQGYNPQLAKSATAQYLINEYYDGLQQMVKNIKHVTAYFDLNPLDILALDFLTPVYLDKYGHTFYVQKVIDYQDGKLTKVELVRIVPTTDRETPDPIFIDYILRGQVQDTSGNPILQADLRVTCVVEYRDGLTQTIVTTTNSDGSFEMVLGQNLESTTYLTVSCITPAGYNVTDRSIWKGMIQGELTYVTLVFESNTQDAYISVRVIDCITGNPIPNARVWFATTDGPSYQSRTSIDGTAWYYRANVPVGGFVSVAIDDVEGYPDSGYQSQQVIKGQREYYFPIELCPLDAFKVTGTVTLETSLVPQEGVDITVITGNHGTQVVQTNPEGKYTASFIELVQGESVRVIASGEKWETAEVTSPIIAAEVTAREAIRDIIVKRTNIIYILWGFVYDSKTELGVEGALVTMKRDELESGTTFTDSRGYYEFIYYNVDRGARFTVEIEKDNYDPYTNLLIATIVGIEAGEERWDHYITPISVEIPHVIVQGTVIDSSDNAPILGATVTINTQKSGAEQVSTDSQGRYGARFENVEPGDSLTVTASANNYNFQRKYDPFTTNEVASQLAIRDFSLEPVEVLTPVTVYGYVYDSFTGDVRVNFQIEVSVQVGGAGSNYRQRVLAYTDENGYYEALVYGSVPDGDTIWSRTVQDGYGSSQKGIGITLIETNPKRWQADHTVAELGYDQGYVNFQTTFVNRYTNQPIKVYFADQGYGGNFYRNGNMTWGFSLAGSSQNGISNCTALVASGDTWRMALSLSANTLMLHSAPSNTLQGTVTEQMIWESAQGANFNAGRWLLTKRYYASSLQFQARWAVSGEETLIRNASVIFQSYKNGNVMSTVIASTDENGFFRPTGVNDLIPYVRMSNLERSDSVHWQILVAPKSDGSTYPNFTSQSFRLDITTAMIDNEDLGNNTFTTTRID